MAFALPSQAVAASYPEHRRRLLSEAMPGALTAVSAITVLYATAEFFLSPTRFYPSIPVYCVLVPSPLLALFLARGPLRLYVEWIALLADVTYSATLASAALLATEEVSSVAMLLSLKIVGTAVLFPWAPGFQCASAGAGLLLYAGLLAASGRSSEAFGAVPNVLVPVASAALSAVGITVLDRTRRALFRDVSVRTRAETALREVQEQLELAVAASGAGLWQWDIRTGHSRYSASWRKLIGYTEHDLGTTLGEWDKLVHPEDAERLPSYVREYLRNPSAPYEIEFRLRHRDGSYRWILSRATLVRDSTGAPQSLLGLHVDITARKQAEERRHQAEKRFQRLFDANILGMIISATDGMVTEANDVFLRMVGWRREDLPRSWDTITPPEWRDADERAVAELRQRGVATPWRKEFVRADGTRLPVLLGGAVFNEGTQLGVGYVIDLTAQVRAEENTAAVLQVAHEISGTLDLPDLCSRVQRQTAHLLRCDRVVTFHWQPAHRALRLIGHFGIPAELAAAATAIEVTANDFPDFGGPLMEGKAILCNDMRQTKGGLAQLSAQFDVTSMAAAPLQVRGTHRGALLAFRSAAGNAFEPWEGELLNGVAREFAVGMEAIEQHAAQRDQAAVSAALVRVGEGLIAALGTPSLLNELGKLTVEALGCDRSHTILRQASGDCFKVVAAHGYPPEVTAGMLAVDLPSTILRDELAALDRTEVRHVPEAEVSEALRAGRRELGINAELVMALRRSGQLIGVHSASYVGREEPFTALQERIARGIAHLASLALDNFRLVQELERANRLKSDFLATISHELRTPLNILIGYNDLLREEAFGRLLPAQHDATQRIDRSARNLLELISDTLDVSRLEAGQVPLQLEDIAPEELLEQIRVESQGLCETKPWLRFHWEAAPGLPRIRTDRVKVKVVIKNLFSNAVKFTDQGQVSVGVAAADGGVEFVVDDTGIGFAPEMMSAIFEAFRQTDEVVARQQGGVGLGLYIVRRLLELLGGTVDVESAPGRGSRFRVRLPLAAGAHGV